jgi:hypothetical protein
MSVIASHPSIVKATFKVGSDDYTAHISSYEWVPTTPDAEVTDIGGTVHKFSASSSWVFNADVIQDFTATGWTTFLLAHETEAAHVTVTTGDANFDADITLVAPHIGGKYGDIGAGSLSFPSSKPIRSALSGS